MQELIDWHFTVQNGMYFDTKTELNGVSIYLSNIIEDGFWNYAFVPSDISLENSIETIESKFNNVNRQPCVYIANSEDCSDKVNKLLTRKYMPLSEESFMTMKSHNKLIVKPSTATTKRVADIKTHNDFIEIFTNAYGGDKTPEQPYGELDKTYIDALIRSFSAMNKFYHFVCYEGKNPVSIATLCFADGKGGLYNVGTAPAYRGKGYGTIATKVCIDQWFLLGGDVLFLQTETGSAVEKWYYKLGFELKFIGRTYCRE
ncbi:hypothetical protein FACS1894190_11350 [Spirochaetia bacterium]|nr:hypothetical protein FACS1894190_11350 [Spirochaetia bacterium]